MKREIADFWANRLITANRRDPNQLFSILAELTETQPSPSPYFASQLIDYLYDEEAALAPVQSWLERTFHKSLNELSLREKNRQTKDQISIGNAFTSLRQLALLDWKECFEQAEPGGADAAAGSRRHLSPDGFHHARPIPPGD